MSYQKGRTAFPRLVQVLGAEVLRPACFRKKGSLFRKMIGGAWQLVEFQRSRKSTSDLVYFTVNLGVCLEALRPPLERSEGPRIEDCHWRERIGFLTGEKRDVWWTIAGESEVEYVANQIGAILTESGLSTLERYANEDALIHLWTSGKSPGLTEQQREEALKAILQNR